MLRKGLFNVFKKGQVKTQFQNTPSMHIQVYFVFKAFFLHIFLRPYLLQIEGKEGRPIAVVGGIGRCKNNNETTNQNLVDEQLLLSSFVRAITIPYCQNTEWTALREFRVQEINEVRK